MQAAQITTFPHPQSSAAFSNELPKDSPIYNFIQSVRHGCLEIISVIPDLSDEQLKAVHDHSADLESLGWIVRAYTRHEFLRRAIRLKGGRGLKDVDEIGLVSLAKKLAVELHVHHTTIMEDARIVEKLLQPQEPAPVANAKALPASSESTGENCSDAPTVSLSKMAELEIIPEKEYYRIAARSDDPRATLAGFAEQKTVNPFFNTRDAYRQEKERKAPPIDEEVPPLIEDGNIKAWYAEFTQLMQSAPTESLKRIMLGAYEEIRYEVQKPNGTRRQQLLACIVNGNDEIDTIAANINQDRIFVTTWLNRLMDDGLILPFAKERPPNARGAARTGHKLTDDGKQALKRVVKK